MAGPPPIAGTAMSLQADRPMNRPISVTAFVDWKAQMHNTRSERLQPPERARRTLDRTARNIRKLLVRKAPAARFTVAMRLYHGWHKGFEQTENLRAITAAASQFKLAAPTNKNVLFSTQIDYGHTLLSTLDERIHIRTAIHLPSTLRERRGGKLEEKMVDTALAADLLHWARRDSGDWALVLAEDDDYIPPVFTAESWIKPSGGRVFVVRTRPNGPFLRLDGLLEELNP